MGKGSQTTVGQWIGDDSEKAAFNCRASEDRISTARQMGKEAADIFRMNKKGKRQKREPFAVHRQ